MRDAEPYAAPTPKILYIHNDLSDYVSRQLGQASAAWHLTRQLFALVCRDPGRVVLLATRIPQELVSSVPAPTA